MSISNDYPKSKFCNVGRDWVIIPERVIGWPYEYFYVISVLLDIVFHV